MKFGVSSYSFKKLLNNGMTYFEVCDEAVKMGYDGIEFVDLTLAHGNGQETLEELAVALREYCAKLGLPIVAYTIGSDFLNGLRCTPAEEPARVKKCVDIACLLGAKVMRHDAFWSMAGLRDWKAAVDRIVPAIQEVADYAKECGIKTCTENHGTIIQDSDRMEYLIRAVDRENYGWLIDLGNFMCADEDPQRAVGVAAPYAMHAHIKDFIFKSGQCIKPEGHWLTTRSGNYLRGTVVGDGVVPIKPCLTILKNAGYDGYVSVEFEGEEDNLTALKNGLAFLRKVDACQG